MKKVKVFKSVEAEVSALVVELNKWIRQSGAKVLGISGNIAPQSGKTSGGSGYVPSDILLIVTYDDGK